MKTTEFKYFKTLRVLLLLLTDRAGHSVGEGVPAFVTGWQIVKGSGIGIRCTVHCAVHTLCDTTLKL